MFSLGHGLAELCRVLEHADQDLQAVQIRVLRRDHLKNGLMKDEEGTTHVCLLQLFVTFACFSHPTK